MSGWLGPNFSHLRLLALQSAVAFLLLNEFDRIAGNVSIAAIRLQRLDWL
jgi:hypothetical protein